MCFQNPSILPLSLMLISHPFFHLIPSVSPPSSLQLMALLTASLRKLKTVSRNALQFPTTMPTHLLTQLWGLPALPHGWTDEPPVLWSTAFPSTYTLYLIFSTLVKNIFKKIYHHLSHIIKFPLNNFVLSA